MDKWAPIAPSKPGGPSGGPGVFSSFGSVLKPHKAGASTSAAQRARAGPRVGRWPEDILARIVGFLPVHDVPAFARANRALARIARHEGSWEARCRVLGIAEVDKEAPPPPQQTTPQLATTASSVGAAVESPKQGAGAQLPGSHGRKPSGSSKRLSVSSSKINIGRVSVDDDWGDFGEAAGDGVFEDVDFGDFAKLGKQQQPPPPIVPAKPAEKNLLDFGDMPLPSRPTGGAGAAGRTTGFFALTPATPVPVAASGSPANASAPGPWYCTYRRRHRELAPYCVHLRNSPSPSSTLSLLFPPDPKTAITPSLDQQGDLLLALILFLDPRLQPVHDWGFLRQALLSAADRFDSTCLVAFEHADSKKDEEGMRMAANASWKVWEAGGGRRHEWECGRVWVEKREVFYETGKWDASENIMKVPDPTGLAIVRELDFTPMDAFMAHVLESFRIDASTAVRVFPPGARVVLSFADKITMDVVGEYINTLLGQTRVMSPELSLRASAASFVQASKVVDVSLEVLGEGQKETPRSAIEQLVFTMFEPHMDEYLDDETEWVKGVLDGICNAWDAELGTNTKGKSSSRHRHKGQQNTAPQFLTSQNPDQVKRNVLAGFRDVLLLPVTIVPRTVTFVGKGIVSGSTQAVAGLSMLNPQKWAMGTTTDKGTPGKMVNGEVVFETDVVQPDDDEKDEVDKLSEAVESTLQVPGDAPNGGSTSVSGAATPNTAVTSGVGTPNPTGSPDGFANLQLLVSLDTALELIHGDRDALKRAETFAKYPGKCGAKVVDAIEEIFIQLLKAVGDRHIAPGFMIATDQMLTYKPSEHAETQSVAPLLQFFELVHVGDTIQSMTQVYFDKEIAQYVDKTDFLNPVMREKKRFEGVLDDAVAAGLNAGIEVLMNQVDHIIVVRTGPREYYPEPGAPMELGATVGCQEAIKCLEMHCNLLKGSTSKEVLEVFYQEVGIRLQGILQRHLKRQIISLEGGFQIIADLNAYHAFVQSLKQQRITDDFANLKMLGHVFIVSDAKDLAQIVRDVTRYGGTFTPEDIYEFIQRRSDWKKIEKTVDKAMYALSVREDCIVM